MRIQQDMNFLNKYWANLADEDEEAQIQQDLVIIKNLALERQIEDQLTTEDQANLDATGFQSVIHKSSKKKSQSKASSSTGKKSYSPYQREFPLNPSYEVCLLEY